MILNYDKIKELWDEKLNNNDNGIIFDVDMFNSPNHTYKIQVNSPTTNSAEIKRVVPVMITAPLGDLLLIPDTYAVDGSMEILFDLFIGDETKFDSLEEENQFKSVNYQKTVQTIQDLILELQTKPQNLGNVALRFGGEDSSFVASGSSTPINTVYIEFTPEDDEQESIFKTDTIEIVKLNNGTFRFLLNGVTKNTTVQYTVGEKARLLLWTDGTDYFLNDDTNGLTDGTKIVTSIEFGNTTGLNAQIYDVRLGNTSLTYADIDTVDDVEWNILYSDFTDVDVVLNNGTRTGFDGVCNNCILWGDEGNIVMGFTTLIPHETMEIDKGYKYQRFSISVPFLFSTDVVLGNHFRYFINLDNDDDGVFIDSEDIEVFAIDRQHTYGSEVTSRQNITGNISKSIVNESVRDVSKTFVYKPNRNMTKLIKKVMTSEIEQNKRYRLRVQAPFFKTDYECIIESGGNSTGLYTLSTFTVQLKEVIDFD